MYLNDMRVNNFRSFDSCKIEFQKDLTVFVGENNGGKSNAMDAIRLLTSPLGGRREIYCEVTDIRLQGTSSHFELEAHFSGLSTGQQGRLISAVTDVSLTKACFGLRFDGSRPGLKPGLWAGKKGNAPEAGCHDMIRHVYLPPLRDAKRSLASGNPTRIMALLNHFLEGTTQSQLAKELARNRSHNVLRKVDTAVEMGLTALTSGVRRQAASLGFATDEALIDIARDLRFRLADHGVDPQDLRYSGHGYANLLFMATIAVELEKVCTADLTLFLVEEPEAHLHPQLQAAVLAFLRDQTEQSRRRSSPDHGPAGEIQVIVATHSPNLSAWVSSDRLVVFKSVVTSTDSENAPIEPAAADAAVIEKTSGLNDRDAAEIGAEALATAVTAATIYRSTRCIPLARMLLKKSERRKVDRYLDVTKAALLFGGRILLVEGIAEALFLQAIAKYHIFKDQPEKLRLFQSVVLVPIDGVDFIPYVKLLLTPVNGARIADRVVALTDGDKGMSAEENAHDADGSGELGASKPALSTTAPEAVCEFPASADDQQQAALPIPGEVRTTALETLAKSLGADAYFVAITSTYSLEAELLEAGNSAILEKAYIRLHPLSRKKWRDAVALRSDRRAKRIHQIFKETRKGDFMQILVRLIESGGSLVVPPYIRKAIEEVVAL